VVFLELCPISEPSCLSYNIYLHNIMHKLCLHWHIQTQLKIWEKIIVLYIKIFSQDDTQLTCSFQFLCPWLQGRYTLAITTVVTPILRAILGPHRWDIHHSEPLLPLRSLNQHTAIVRYRYQQAPVNILAMPTITCLIHSLISCHKVFLGRLIKVILLAKKFLFFKELKGLLLHS
jgi:hypothetical protein